MNMIEPFAALRVHPDHAERVAAPPYDVLDTQEARALAADNEDSFLHVSKPEIDFPPGTDPTSPEVYAAGRRALDRLVERGRLRREGEPCFYVYRLVMGEHEQTGVVGAASVAAYRQGRIKRHEHTNPDKVVDRARNADALNAHTGTLFLTYRSRPDLDEMVREITARPADTDIVAEDGVRHTLWVVASRRAVAFLREAFAAMPAVYIADGHHRSAAAELLCSWRRQARERGDKVAPAERFLAVLFPDEQVQILPYHRVVTTLGGRTDEEFLAALAERFEVRPSATAVQPDAPGEIGLFLPAGWYRLRARNRPSADDPVAGLDVSVLARECLEPLLGIVDPRTDERIDFVGGIRGTAELERRVHEGRAAAAFSLPATSLADVLAVADAGQVMPPKSTWFEPKLRDGLLVLPLG